MGLRETGSATGGSGSDTARSQGRPGTEQWHAADDLDRLSQSLRFL